MSEQTSPEADLLVVGNNLYQPWGRATTEKKARSLAGLSKNDHYTVYYFRHDHWVVNEGYPSYPPDVEPPVAVTKYKSEIIKVTLHNRGEVTGRGQWKGDLTIVEHPPSSAKEREKTIGRLVHEPQESKWMFNPKANDWGQPTWIPNEK